jgi:hypothetical protein
LQTTRRLISWTALVAAIALPAGCSGSDGPSSSAIPRQLAAQSRPIGRGPQYRPPAAGPILGPCRRSLGAHFGIHVEVFAASRVVIVPAGIGTRPPRIVFEDRIARARCYGKLVTLEPTGVVLVRTGSQLTLSAVFRSWGEPLSAQATVFVDGLRWRGAPGAVLLNRHAEIVVETGPYVPPHRTYLFPPGT